MLYDVAIDEELEQMEQDAVLKARNVLDIKIPLRALMRPVITITLGCSVQDAIDVLLKHKVGAAPVVDANQKLSGIFGERDVLRKILNKSVGNLEEMNVEQFMLSAPETARADDSLDTAILYMARGGYRHLPIVDEQHQPVGMVSIRDVISYLVDSFPQEVLTLPPSPVRDAMKAREGA